MEPRDHKRVDKARPRLILQSRDCGARPRRVPRPPFDDGQPSLSQRCAEAAVHQFVRASHARHRLVVLAHLRMGHAELDVPPDPCRVEVDGLAELDDRFFEPAQGQELVADIVRRVHGQRIDGLRPASGMEPFVGPSHQRKEEAVLAMREIAAGVELDRP